MALTLAHMAKIEKDPLKAYVIMNMIRDMPMMEQLPFENIQSLNVAGLRWKNLPTVAFRSLNEGYTPSEGDVEQVWESLYGLGGDIQFDRVFDLTRGSMLVDPKKLQTNMKIKSMALTFNDYFINGSAAVDPKGFTGLKARVANMPSRQTVYFAGSSSAALDPTSSAANARALIDGLEKMHYRTNKGGHNLFLGNEGMKWGLGRAVRYVQAGGGNWLSVTTDQFDREIPTLWGSKFHDIGFKKDQSTEIITETETAGDAGSDATSVYCVAFNMDQGIMGAQLEPLNPYDPLSGGEQESKPSKLIRIDWWLGLVSMGSYGITRGRNVEGASNWT